jgi:tetratricopeptide (TPR) repeat protein
MPVWAGSAHAAREQHDPARGGTGDGAAYNARCRMRSNATACTAVPMGRPVRMNYQELLCQAFDLHQRGRLREALADYRRVLAAQPDNPNALNLAGVAHAALGETGEAAALLERCTRAAPGFADAHANLGLAYRALGRHEDALRAQRRVLELNPDNAPALNALGVSLRRLGRYGEAVCSFEQAIAAEPAAGDAHANLGNVLQDLDRMDEAVASYREALARDACAASVYRGLGNALQRLHRFDEAIEAYRDALARDPDYVPALTDLGGALVEAGRAAQGAVHLRAAAQRAPDDPIVHSNLGMALHDSGDTDGALAAFERALALDPGNTHALAYQGITLHATGARERWRWLTGLDRLVREMPLPVPPHYASVAALNEALAEHARAHPSVWQGRRRGISSELFLDGEGPPLALRDSLREAVQRYIDELPEDRAHPFVARRPQRYVLSGWCNVLDEGAAAHVHPNAWLSGAYYVRTEGVVGDAVDDLSGCLQVGAPDPEHYATQDYEVRVFRPREGYLVVFPSYVWHRILPFAQRGTRISYAFDVVPV